MKIFEVNYLIDNGYKDEFKTTFVIASSEEDARDMIRQRCNENDWLLKSIDNCIEHELTEGSMIDRKRGWVENV